MQKAKAAKSRINQLKAAKAKMPPVEEELGMQRMLKAKAKKPKSPAEKPRSQEAKKPRSQEAKKPKSQEAKKPRSQEAKKPRSQKAKKPRSQEAKKPRSQKRKRKKDPKINTPQKKRRRTVEDPGLCEPQKGSQTPALAGPSRRRQPFRNSSAWILPSCDESSMWKSSCASTSSVRRFPEVGSHADPIFVNPRPQKKKVCFQPKGKAPPHS